METLMMTELTDEIKVGVIFGPEHPQVRPVWFVWRGRRHSITEITYTWKVKEGRSTLVYFAVQVPEGDIYQLAFDSQTSHWWLEGVETE